MLLKTKSSYKKFNNAELHARVIALNKVLSDNYGRELAITNKALDELYQIILFALEQGNKEALLEAAESLKLAYGLARKGEKIREDEYLYWREAVLATLAKEEFQAVEYLVESSRNLLKIFAEKRDVIVDTLKMVANMAMQERKFFIAAAVMDILLYWLHRLEKENKKTAAAIAGCLASIGSFALQSNDRAFFKEICALLRQNMRKTSQEQEFYWDRLMLGWLNICLKDALYKSYKEWQQLFFTYRKLRVGYNTAFYADIITLASRYVLKLNDRLLQELLADILQYTWLNATHMECIVCARSVSDTFRNITNIVVWEKSVFVFKPFFFFCFHLAARFDKQDEWTALGRTMLSLYFDGIVQAAAFAIVRFDCSGPLQVLYKWREFFLKKSQSRNSQRRIKFFWLLCAQYWLEDNAGEVAENNLEFLAKFQE